MFPRVIVLIAVSLHTVLGVSTAKRQTSRIFSEGYIEGMYGRFFEYTEDGASSPCPRVIDHFNRGFPSALGNSWTVPHDKIAQNGISCNDRGVLVLNSFNSTSKMPDRIKSNQIAVETFADMKRDSTGFWMGADARTCGKWVFPNPSFVFFVKEIDRVITTSFRLQLEVGQKYMFIVAPEFTCIYLDVPRSSPDPNVILIPGDASNPPEGTNGKEPTSTPSSSDNTPADSTDKEPPSKPADDTDDSDSGSSDMSIVDIQNGATPLPTKTPRPETIQDVLEGEEGKEEDDSATAILNEDDVGEEANETNDFFDVTMQAGDSLCFPGSATVELKNGRTIHMNQLSIGDEVRVGEGYSRIFGFTHKDPYTRQNFIRLTTRSGKSITLTAGHYLYANNQLIPAKDAHLGDRLRLLAGDGTVERVERVIRKGLYNPHTETGELVVNGVITSCYTTAISTWPAHALLTPFRAIWHVYRLRSLTFLEAGTLNNELARWWGSIPHMEL